MISFLYRFHRRSDLQRLYRVGKAIRGRQCTLRYDIVPGRETYRASVVVSRKVSKSAVVRNRIRRRIYEQIRLHQAQFVPGLDMAVVVYDASFATTPAAVLAKDFDNLLKKASILRADRETRGIVDKKL